MVKQMQLKNVIQIPSEQLDDWGPVPVPVGELICRVRGLSLGQNADGSEAGVWECSPGKFVRQIMQPEVSTFLQGRARFYPEGGEPYDIQAGDVIYYPPNSKGVWEIFETVRKTFFVYGEK